jgi:hypothetical protein
MIFEMEVVALGKKLWRGLFEVCFVFVWANRRKKQGNRLNVRKIFLTLWE